MKPFSFQALFLVAGAILVTLFAGCSEEITTVEILTVTPDFEELPRSRDPYRRIFNIYKYADNMVLHGEGADFLHEPDSNVTTYISRVLPGFQEETSSSLRLTVFANSVGVYPIGFQLDQLSWLNLRLDTIIPDYQLPINDISYRRKMGCLSDDNHLLLPYRTRFDRKLRFVLAKITPSEFTLDRPVLNSIDTFAFEIEGSEYRQSGLEMLPVDGGFLFTHSSPQSGNSMHRISYDGDFEEVVSTSISQLFYFRGIPHAHRYRDNQSQILTADADGRNWRISWSFPNPIFERFHFFPVGDDLFMYSATGGRMFFATQMDEEAIAFEAVEFTELESYDVTDIEEYQGDIYIGTLSGFFRRDYLTFRESRETE